MCSLCSCTVCYDYFQGCASVATSLAHSLGSVMSSAHLSCSWQCDERQPARNNNNVVIAGLLKSAIHFNRGSNSSNNYVLALQTHTNYQISLAGHRHQSDFIVVLPGASTVDATTWCVPFGSATRGGHFRNVICADTATVIESATDCNQ